MSAWDAAAAPAPRQAADAARLNQAYAAWDAAIRAIDEARTKPGFPQLMYCDRQ